MVTCPTCNSSRCGNHAACARRGIAATVWRTWCDSWVMIGACEEAVQKALAQVSLIQRAALRALPNGEELFRVRTMGLLFEEYGKGGG